MARVILQTRFRGLPKSTGEFGDVDGIWIGEGVFTQNRHGEISAAGQKFLRTIDRDRYQIRWVPVEKVG